MVLGTQLALTERAPVVRETENIPARKLIPGRSGARCCDVGASEWLILANKCRLVVKPESH